ncbi:MAG: transglycosylase domain-containing protein [Candidatus Limnocylindrales bacterium]
MPYRPQKRSAPRTSNGTGNGTHHRGSYAARLAIARSNARRKGPSGPNAVLVLLLVLVVSGVTVASAAAITAGGAAAVTIATLDEGLPDVRSFPDLDFNEETVMTTRDGKVELAKFWEERRKVVDFEDIPAIVLDATTATEDDTFWDNPGVDLTATINALVTEAGGGGNRGGGSTITQQLVRARLLPQDVIDNDNTKEGLYLRKAKEILQAYKLTQAFPGEEGKREIITAYLNQIPYGAAYGVAAAADVYFGKKLDQLTISEAALLAAIPQEPANLYPYAKNKKGKYANVVKEKYGKKVKRTGKQNTRLVIKSCVDKGGDCVDTELVQRRNFILRRLYEGKGRWTSLTEEQYQAALKEKITIKKERKVRFKSPQFVEAAVKELVLILGDREPYNVGGYKVTTTLDWKAQQLGEKYIYAGAIVPNLPASQYFAAIRKYKLGRDAGWIANLRGLSLRNGAMVAVDYRTGDILAYVGSAGYYRKSNTAKFDPKYDHVGLGKRQPGSAWKPIVYATGIDANALTAGTVLLDITTPFGGVTADGKVWAPKDADSRDRGPVQVREALQQSLNIPAIRALDRVGVKTVRKYAVKAGFEFLPTFGNQALDVAGLAGGIGTVEVRPLDMTTAFGAFGNSGKVTRPRYILKVEGPKGEVIYEAGKPVTTQVWSPQTAYIMADILKGNADPSENDVWADTFAMYNTRDGSRRELAIKTGTTNNLKDYSTYGLLPMPKNPKQPALAVGVWFGNSDSTPPNLSRLVYSLDNAGKAWNAFVRDYMNNKPVARFKPPKTGVVTATIRTATGGNRQELFIRGTQPGGNKQVDPVHSCSTPITQLENPGAPASWLSAVTAWAARANGSTSQWGSVKTASGSCYSGGSSLPGTSDGSSSGAGSSGGGGSSSGGNNNSGGGGGGGPQPAPTCRPGFTDKPQGCVISF